MKQKLIIIKPNSQKCFVSFVLRNHLINKPHLKISGKEVANDSMDFVAMSNNNSSLILKNNLAETIPSLGVRFLKDKQIEN